MAKLKTAILRAQETSDFLHPIRFLGHARIELNNAIDDLNSDNTRAKLERTLVLINAYLMETEPCKQ